MLKGKRLCFLVLLKQQGNTIYRVVDTTNLVVVILLGASASVIRRLRDWPVPSRATLINFIGAQHTVFTGLLNIHDVIVHVVKEIPL